MSPPAFHAQKLAAAGVRHAFFGRRGGVSRGLYESLNAGPGSRDAPEAVAENRRRIAAAMAVGADRLVTLHQIHSARAVRVSAPFSGPPTEADAVVTAQPGLALAVLSADCTPVLLADPDAGVVAAAHAGWRGALGGVLEAAVAAMAAAGAAPARMIAAIGPTIRQESYEVGPEFVDAFLKEDADNQRFFAPGAGDRAHFDLPGFCAGRLARAGVGAIEDLGLDTYARDADFFSHRRGVHAGEADYGRNCAAIAR